MYWDPMTSISERYVDIEPLGLAPAMIQSWNNPTRVVIFRTIQECIIRRYCFPVFDSTVYVTAQSNLSGKSFRRKNVATSTITQYSAVIYFQT